MTAKVVKAHGKPLRRLGTIGEEDEDEESEEAPVQPAFPADLPAEIIAEANEEN